MKFVVPENGQDREKRFFALRPVRIGRLVRWLEMVTCYQTYNAYTNEWKNLSFTDLKGEEA